MAVQVFSVWDGEFVLHASGFPVDRKQIKKEIPGPRPAGATSIAKDTIDNPITIATSEIRHSPLIGTIYISLDFTGTSEYFRTP